ncbi:MAG: ADP-ribosylglycohydrolase family protein, partial [Planctomycetota bacterium]
MKMNKGIVLCVLCVVVLVNCADCAQQAAKEIPLDVLKDKIKGGWAGQTISCTYGGPTEFRFRSKMIPDDYEIPWYDGYMKDTYDGRPGLYDDIYMDLTFVEVFEKEGLDAPAESFASAFANADYMLWHANQCARYNILNGIMPPESGHWLNNPCADDIDFQIEADFAGLMSPGMVNTSAEISDKIGHIMNYGDGWYGGVYVAALYATAFVSDDTRYVVEEALEVIPPESLYAQCMRDVIQWHKENPDDWKATWIKVHGKWDNDVGCPNGAFSDFNIDAKINSAWILVGLLYGEKDFGKTIDISTRCGDDSDCNPASAGGILGTMIGYDNIPDYWKQGL